MKRIVTILISVWIFFGTQAQESPRIGLVLSGGGADGLAHVGMLKALEEHGIYPTHITGSSMGALIGGLYASGYTPEEMEAFFKSETYLKMVNGQTEEKYIYEWSGSNVDPSIVSLSFAKDSIFKAKLPTNLINPSAIDFELMARFAAASENADYNFDSLFIPFRCVASDIYTKQTVTFDSGSVATAVRASMSYPFFIKPLLVDDVLLFDGGLYNNFPADIMCEAFNPTYIIGSKVASNGPPPNEDDLYSQVRALLVNETSFDVNCIENVIIEPSVNFGVFEFENASEAIDSGYYATIKRMPELKSMVFGIDINYTGINEAVFSDSKIFEKKREQYRSRLQEVFIKEVKVDGLNKNQAKYVEKILFKKSRKANGLLLEQAKTNFFRLVENKKVAGAYPEMGYDTAQEGFIWLNKVKVQNDVSIKFGGNFGSRPISSGYAGVQYNRLAGWGLEAEGSAQFGKLYAAGHARVRFDIPSRIPLYIEPSITFHRWDYFESRFNTLFTDNIPSFVVTQEQIAGITSGVPIGNRGVLGGRFNYYRFNDEYYQSKSFTPGDTVDQSRFEGFSLGIFYNQNNLNHKQYPTSGKRIRISSLLVRQTEEYTPGSTSLDSSLLVEDQEWLQIKLELENYFNLSKRIKIGLEATGFYSSQPLFNNYTSSIIRANAYQPTPDSKTLFLESFRANQYVAGGIKFVYKFSKNWQARLEGYIFQPYQAINKEQLSRDGQYGDPFEVRHTIANGTLVYDSPIGPFSASVNYYYNNTQVSPGEENPVTFLFNYGFILFRDRALH